MKYFKVSSRVLSEALKDKRKFSVLSLYIGEYQRSDGYFVSTEHPNKECVCNLKAALLDFLFNEIGSEEWDALYEIGERILGRKDIDLKLIAVVDF